MHVVHQNGGWNAVHLMVFGFPSLWYCSPNGVWYSYLGISGELLARDVSLHLSLYSLDSGGFLVSSWLGTLVSVVSLFNCLLAYAQAFDFYQMLACLLAISIVPAGPTGTLFESL